MVILESDFPTHQTTKGLVVKIWRKTAPPKLFKKGKQISEEKYEKIVNEREHGK
jgi:hypothetical protein